MRQIISIVLATMMLANARCMAETSGSHGVSVKRVAIQGACPSQEALAPLLSLGSVYLGEVHGTNEIPQLVGCLVDATLASGVKPLTVSLELPDFARDTKTLTWSGLVGKTSKAMGKLVEHLEDLESAHRITLDFQVTGYEASDEAMNHEVGMHLRDLATKSRVIALGGSFHSQRKNVLFPSLDIRPAGSYVGSAMKTVFMDSVSGGSAWICSKTCGEHVLASATHEGHIGQLVDGAPVGHDFIYKIGAFTASATSPRCRTRRGESERRLKLRCQLPTSSGPCMMRQE